MAGPCPHVAHTLVYNRPEEAISVGSRILKGMDYENQEEVVVEAEWHHQNIVFGVRQVCSSPLGEKGEVIASGTGTRCHE